MLDPIPPTSPLSPLPRVSRKGKEREGSPAPTTTDLAERMIAFQRRTAGSTRPKDRPAAPAREPVERSPPAPTRERADRVSSSRSPVLPHLSPRKHSSQATTPQPPVDTSGPSAEDFSRRLKITDSAARPSARGHAHAEPARRLFNPNADAIPMRRTAEPEAMSDAASSEARGDARRGETRGEAGHRQLFDHRKDDPVRFSVFTRPGAPAGGGRAPPTPKSSGDYVSASSTSSYAHSLASSSFTLSSGTTDGSSASSALFEGGRAHEETGTNAFSAQLKRLYRAISALEMKIIQDDALENSEEVRVVLKGKRSSAGSSISAGDEDAERERWRRSIADHKRLAEMMHNLLEISLAPSVPASLRNIPNKYNIITRLWTHAFYKLLESLRRASFTQPMDTAAFEHLQDFIYYAYSFYTGLVEERTLDSFRSNWLEALGDLARYRMAVAAMTTSISLPSSTLTMSALSNVAGADSLDPSIAETGSVSDSPAARIDDSPVPSIGLAAARLLDIEPEKERWRNIAREWYSAGVANTPGAGKLHHHLGLLSRELDGEELRGIYHFTKSMTTLHPFPTSRESILPIWSLAAQARRQQADASATDLFVLLHGMLFTNIQLDDFTPTLARFLERLELEGAEERAWTMMAVVNVASVLEYGKPTGVIRRTGGVGPREAAAANGAAAQGKMRVLARREEEGEDRTMDVDDEDIDAARVSSRKGAPTVTVTPPAASATPAAQPEAGAGEHPVAFKLALQLTMAVLAFTLRRPTRKASAFARSTLNPYNTVLLTFLATVLRHGPTLGVLERSVPWAELAAFMGRVPRAVLAQADAPGGAPPAMLTSGCAPLDEDWCVRGMEWVGRRVYERGFWKSGDERQREREVLERGEEEEAGTDGIIEDEDEVEGGGEGGAGRAASENGKRWVRLARAGVAIAKVVDGFGRVSGRREWAVDGALKQKVEAWKEEDRQEREEEERRRRRTRWDEDSMDIDDEGAGDASEESEADEADSEEVKALKARRRYLRNLLESGQREEPAPRRHGTGRPTRKAANTGPSLHIVAGYTILVIDTNLLLSALSMFASMVESMRWTVVVPLPVVMELDGLSANASALGEAAARALAYVTAHVRTHARSLKVQTSKGNYLVSLSVRTEAVDFADAGRDAWERNMDDLILRAAIWQDEHWADRSGLLGADVGDAGAAGAAKVVLLSFDRNLRLKARARQLAAANEQDLAAVLAAGT